MSHTEGVNAMETALRYVGQQDTTAEGLLLRNMAEKKRGTAIKQTVNDFFYESL
jgi:hypothetical protein